MIHLDIDIKKQNDGSYFLIGESTSLLVNHNDLVIESIFWYPLVEMDYYEFVLKLKNRGYDDFPVILLIKSIILRGTFYWINRALIWYDNLPIYDSEIQIELNNLLVNSGISKLQDLKQNIKNVLTRNNRLFVDELYKIYKSEKETFVDILVKKDIKYIEFFKEDVLCIVSNSKKYDFPL
ncbi:hypothetical protein B4N84_09625 [Flavobacterium sp. IR1]|nr:hypothetical protein B4N84_09625 [Flavobacterium sp. IR1]